MFGAPHVAESVISQRVVVPHSAAWLTVSRSLTRQTRDSKILFNGGGFTLSSSPLKLRLLPKAAINTFRPKFSIIMSAEVVVEAASKRLSNLGEGPHWDPLTQKLFYVDAFVGDICQLDPASGETESVPFDGTVTLVVPYRGQRDKLLITLGKQVRKLNWKTKDSEVVAVVDPENPKTRFNDGKCDPRGRLWTGTLIEGQAEGGSLYSLDSSYKFRPFADKITVSNGLTWTLDYKTLFYIDSEARRIYAFDFDLETGTASNQRILIDYNIDDGYGDLGVPDGMTIDIDGKLWVACFGGGCVIRVDPDTKKILQKVSIPATKTTSCCFGGPHFDTLYVTTAWMGLSDEDRKAEPQAGAVFSVKNLPARGQNAYEFIEA